MNVFVISKEENSQSRGCKKNGGRIKRGPTNLPRNSFTI